MGNALQQKTRRGHRKKERQTGVSQQLRPSAKGQILEDSVSAIEQTVLRVAANASGFTVYPRRRIVSEGVTHEIDLWVTIHNVPGYDVTVIFECKNWHTKKVGKNDILVFSEKIRVSKAQRGFFIATTFTKDALAQAKKDSRIEIMSANVHSGDKFLAPYGFHLIVMKHNKTFLDLTPDEFSIGPAIEDGAIADQRVLADGRSMSLNDYVSEWRTQLENNITCTFPSADLPAGSYPREVRGEREFDGNLAVNGRVIKSASLEIGFDIIVVHPTIHVSIGDRGTTFHMVTEATGGEIRATLASVPRSLATKAS
jgi:hypothetical protein